MRAFECLSLLYSHIKKSKPQDGAVLQVEITQFYYWCCTSLLSRHKQVPHCSVSSWGKYVYTKTEGTSDEVGVVQF